LMCIPVLCAASPSTSIAVPTSSLSNNSGATSTPYYKHTPGALFALIDMRLHVRLGKGGKDRSVIMPQSALDAMRWYWCTHRNPTWIFPAGTNHVHRLRAKQPMGGQSIQRAIKAIALECNIHKNITTHSLRHCYATHLLGEGLNLHAIQQLLRHESPLTTAIYTQLTESAQQNTATIIDQMLNNLSYTLDRES